MNIIGLDVGEKRIGVAKVDSEVKIAVPVGFVEVDGLEWQKISSIARINHTNLFVLGLPRNNQGEETKQSLFVRNFAKTLIEKIPGARVRFQDESLTSVVAEERLKKRKKGYQKGDIDTEAATIILQDFVDSFSNHHDSPFLDKQSSTMTNENSSTPDGVATINAIDSKIPQAVKQGANSMLFKAKRTKQKVKTTTKWISSIIILVIVALLATGGVLLYKKIRTDERQAEYAKLEAEMSAEVFDFTILPGETLGDIKTNLLELGYSEIEIDTAFSKQYGFEFLEERPSGATLEGYLFGNTHQFYKTASVEEVLLPFLEEMKQVIEKNELKARYAEHGLSLFEGITLASIIQKEAAPKDQPTVAQVFLSRLSYGMPLGSDVTVSYAIDQVDPGRETYTDNQSALTIDSCYNTRSRIGLPCGPISNPGISALLAVAEPTETSYLYFLTGDDGVMYYSYTESEHLQNSHLHCQELCNISL